MAAAGDEWWWARQKITTVTVLSALWLVGSGLYTDGFEDVSESDMRWIVGITLAPPALLMLYSIVARAAREIFLIQKKNGK